MAGAEALCILPWIHLEVAPEGVCKPCNVAREAIRERGAFLSVAGSSLPAIRDSRYLRLMRRALASGSRIPVCSYCWEQEDRGEGSLREMWNRAFAPALEMLKRRLGNGVDPAGPMPVEYLQLSLGNQCHMACRMCNGTYSSRIETDPVHGRWAPRFDRSSEIVWTDFDDRDQGTPQAEPIAGSTRWFERPELDRDLLEAGPTLKRLYVTGGEPFSTPAFDRILEAYLASGHARHITVVVNTSLFLGRDRISRALPRLLRFEHCHLGPSIDGIGPVFEYIRYPARWSLVEQNLRHVEALRREHSNLSVQISTVVQAYNCLHLVELLRFADELSLGCFLHVLDDPPQLRPGVLPPELRARAAEQLVAYADSPAISPAGVSNRSHAARISRYLQGLQESPDLEELRRGFLAFTRELDDFRGQDWSSVSQGRTGLTPDRTA